ncbi:hypothetical protein BgiBS90_013071, partial [Biomphalaria glabrata]
LSKKNDLKVDLSPSAGRPVFQRRTTSKTQSESIYPLLLVAQSFKEERPQRLKVDLSIPFCWSPSLSKKNDLKVDLSPSAGRPVFQRRTTSKWIYLSPSAGRPVFQRRTTSKTQSESIYPLLLVAQSFKEERPQRLKVNLSILFCWSPSLSKKNDLKVDLSPSAGRTVFQRRTTSKWIYLLLLVAQSFKEERPQSGSIPFCWSPSLSKKNDLKVNLSIPFCWSPSLSKKNDLKVDLSPSAGRPVFQRRTTSKTQSESIYPLLLVAQSFKEERPQRLKVNLSIPFCWSPSLSKKNDLKDSK